MRWGALALAVVIGCTSGPSIVELFVPARASISDLSVSTVESAGITVSPTHVQITEGGTAVFSVALDSAPKAPVTLGIESNDPTRATVSPAELTFTPDNWQVRGKIVVRGTDDFRLSGDHPFKILVHRAFSEDLRYDGIDPADVIGINLNSDAPGVVLKALTPRDVTFGEPSARFSVRLATIPTADVTIGLTSSDPSQGTATPSSLTFTPATWSEPQIVTVGAVDDFIAGGNQFFEIVTAPAVSGDSGYSGLDAANLTFTNHEVDHVGISITPTSGLITTEFGSDSFTVQLSSKPTAPVTLNLTSSDLTHGSPSPAALVFTGGNWPTPQPVTVLGHNDNLDTGNLPYSIITAALVSADVGYNGLNPPNVSVLLIDSVIVFSRVTGLKTVEPNGTDTFTIRLSSPPTSGTVTINLSSDNLLLGTVSPASVVFDGTDWNVPKTITAKNVPDSVNRSGIYHVVTAPAIAADPKYSNFDAFDVSVTHVDRDIGIYGSGFNQPFVMEWCSPKTNCPGAATALDVTIQLGATVNWYLNDFTPPTAEAHGAVSTDVPPPAWFPDNTTLLSQDNVAPKFVTTPTATGNYPFKCWIHGLAMVGTIHVN